MRRFFPKYLMPWLMITMLGFTTACTESERATCSTTADCSSDQICRAGACIIPSAATCESDEQCSTGYICVANTCARNYTDDVGLNDVNPNDVNSTDDTSDHDVPPDTTNPRVTSVFPPADARDVATNTAITVTFNKRMEHVYTLNSYSFKLRDPDGHEVTEATLSYDEATETAKLTPTKPLRAAARYEIIVTPDITDESGNSLFQTYTFFFYTLHNPPADHAEIADLYAPIIYQGIRTLTGSGPNTDIPTRVDFDGDLVANNNKQNAAAVSADIRAHVYYHVTETPSHYFVQYILYYPTRTYLSPLKVHEHDLTGITVTMDKASGDVLLIEGVLVEDTSFDPILSYRPESSPVRAQAQTLRVATVPDSAFVDGTKTPLFITSGQHIPCNWFVRGGETSAVKRCPADTQRFPGGDTFGAIIRPGNTAQKFAEATVNADTGLKEMTYKLIPFVDTFWLNRSDFSCGLYTTHVIYKPDNRVTALADRPVGAQANHPLTLPNRLCTNDDISFGKLPFTWDRYEQYSGGQWFLDPVYRLASQFNMSGGTALSPKYCQNIFFNIDDRTAPNCDE